MGCGNVREKIENEMIEMKMERTKIQMERRNNIKLLEEIDGRKIKRPIIPDFILDDDKVKKNNKKKIIINKKINIKSKRINKETSGKPTINTVKTKRKSKSQTKTTGFLSKK